MAESKIELLLHEQFIKKKLTLSLAESCTGGSFAARLTRLPGASQYFLGSVVAYSNAMKIQWLGVQESLIVEKGAVSEEVVAQMLKGVMERTGSDYGAAVSGIAGPDGGTPDKPVGTVWHAVGRRGERPHIWKTLVQGNREVVIERSVDALIAELLLLTS